MRDTQDLACVLGFVQGDPGFPNADRIASLTLYP